MRLRVADVVFEDTRQVDMRAEWTPYRASSRIARQRSYRSVITTPSTSLTLFVTLVKMIDSTDASHAAKDQAKSHLKRFLEHPLVVSVLGTSAASILPMLHK